MPDVADAEELGELVLLPAGSTFGNYVIHECIGQGAMGNIYRAEHALLEKAVALKVLDASLLSNADARQRFLREGQAAAAIKHPNVVDITDVGVFEGTPYLVMELLEGEDLQIHLQRRERLSEREIASLLIPVVAALGAAHDRGVVHRDLKPSNIFLARAPDGEVIPKILDFGISKLPRALDPDVFRSTPCDQLMGSPLYLPPEAVRGSRELTAKSDQYSLGVVLYECVTGRPPFSGDSLLSILEQIAAGDLIAPSRLRPDVSPAMERVIRRALNADPAQRFDHVRDLGRELLEVAGVRTQMLWGRTFGRIDLSEPHFDPRNTSPIVLSRLAASAPPAPPPQRRSVRHVVIGVAALAAILVPSFRSMRSPPEPDRSTPLVRQPETGEAALTPLRSPGAPGAASRGAASTSRVLDERSDVSEGAGVVSRAAPAVALPKASAPGAGPAPPPASAAFDAAGPRASLRESAIAREPPRGSRRGRASNPEPRGRVSLASDPRPPRPARTELLVDPLVGDSPELLAPPVGPEPAPGAPKRRWRREQSRPAPDGAYAGANESPILD